MIILVNGATRTVERFPECGRLVSPRKTNSIAVVTASGRPWAADNDCFQGLDVEAYRRMLGRIAAADRSRLLWVTVPDVVGDAQATLDHWTEWYPQIDHLGLPAALVAQDGLERLTDQIRWHELTALFIGGSTAWKLGEAAEALGREAKARGKWLHVGRVNTRRRVRDLAMMFAADSIDGRSFSAWPDAKIPAGLSWIRGAARQGTLFRDE